jgi:hypothetical protein
MLGVIVVYFGLVTMLTGGVSVVKPLKLLTIHSRRQGLAILVTGFLIVVIGTSLPAKETRVTAPDTQLDQFIQVWQFGEFHSIRIVAPKERVYVSLQQVTANEIHFFRTLIWIRRFGRPGPESILNPPPDTPLLQVATKTSFIVLAEEPNREFVVGTLVAAPRGWRPAGRKTPEGFKALAASAAPGYALAAMNFRLGDCAPSNMASLPCTVLTTETRVYATDASSRRAFARYWRVIYPGSSLIRRMWLRAVKERAERP